MSLSSTVLNLGGTRPRTRWLANIPTGKYACVVLVMYAPYAYEGACACVRPPEHIYYGPLVVDILTLMDELILRGLSPGGELEELRQRLLKLF